MISSVRSFGAPVIDPPGKQARTQSTASVPSRSRPSTVDTSWCTVAYVSVAMSRETRTVPVRQTRPRSLRSRSTIIRFSARVLASATSASRSWASSCGSAPRGAVPLMGLASATPSRVTRRNRSGEEPTTSRSPNLR